MSTLDEMSAPPDPMLGQTLVDRYRLIRRVGEGGMGTVYEAEQAELNRSVAVKVLRDKYADRPEVARRLVKEAQLASSIEHDHIVRILDSGTTRDGRPFIVMEHLIGESLADRIRREGALPESLVLGIAEQATSALAAAHERSIVHRDIKPENVFLVDEAGPAPAGTPRPEGASEGSTPSVKIVDFGISKSMAGEQGDSNMRLTATGMVLGTPLYMSPEQARGDDELDERVDVYALGVILYEALTGETPFRASNYLGVISQVLSAELIPPRQLRPELSISPGIERIVMRAMSRDRTQRYPSMSSMAEDLRRVHAGGEVTVEAMPVAPSPRALWPIAILLGIVTVGVLAVPLWDPHHKTLPTITVSPTTRPERPPQAKLSLASDPPGASIVVRGASLGTTPREVLLPRGPTEVTLTLEGYEPARTTVDIGKQHDVTLTLRELPKVTQPALHAHPTHATSQPVAKPSTEHGPNERPGEETLPNPY